MTLKDCACHQTFDIRSPMVYSLQSVALVSIISVVFEAIELKLGIVDAYDLKRLLLASYL